MSSSNQTDDYIARLRSRYPRDNSILDLLHLLDMMREEITALRLLLTQSDRGHQAASGTGGASPEQLRRWMDEARQKFSHQP